MSVGTVDSVATLLSPPLSFLLLLVSLVSFHRRFHVFVEPAQSNPVRADSDKRQGSLHKLAEHAIFNRRRYLLPSVGELKFSDKHCNRCRLHCRNSKTLAGLGKAFVICGRFWSEPRL